MRSQSLLTLLVPWMASCAIGQQPHQPAGIDEIPELLKVEEDTPVIPGRYIVEFDSRARLQDAEQSIKSRRGYSVRKFFNEDGLFYGASIQISDDADAVTTLMSDSSVARVWPLRNVKLIRNVAQQNYSDVVDAIDYNIHGPTGVEALHEEGILGEGATIAVIDTGIDYTHPGLGGGFGEGYSVVGGKDLVGDGCWPLKGCPLEPDDDPMDYLGHGTHVAGIIAGQSQWFTGVAPKARILAYKVFTDIGFVTEDILIESFLQAFADGADVISASIGGLSGWQDSAWAVVADRLVEKGAVVTIAAGNDGNFGPFMFSNGAAGRNVLGVASTEPDILPSAALEVAFTNDGETNDTNVGYLPLIPWPIEIKDWPVVHVGSGCRLPDDLDLTGKIALVERWFCSVRIKEANILAAGGLYILNFDPVEPDRDGFYGGDWDQIVWAELSEKDGQAFAAALGDGYKLNVTVPRQDLIVGVDNIRAGTPSYFTSFGATYDHALKPDIGAPGSGILSLHLHHGFAAMDGTSMATPYVAGVAALYVGKYGGRSKHGAGFGKMLSARILSSGSRVTWGDSSGLPLEGGIPATVAQTGNGLVNATKVLNSDTQLSFTKFALNDTQRFSRYHSVEITNNSPDPATYTFDLEAAGAFEAYQWSGGNPSIPARGLMINNVLEITPDVKMPAGAHRLAPGQTKKVEFTFKIPEGMSNVNMPVYSGKVLVKGSNGDELSVPYLGVGGNTGKEIRNRLWHRALGYPVMLSDYDDTIEDHNVFTFNTSLGAQDFPKLEAVVNFGSPEMRWDIFEEGWKEREWKYPPVPGKDGFVGSVASWTGSSAGLGAVFDPEYDDADDVVPFPFVHVTRNALYSAWWLGRLANGTDIAPGKYNMRIAVLAPFGNPHASDNWDRFSTPMIEVVVN